MIAAIGKHAEEMLPIMDATCLDHLQNCILL